MKADWREQAECRDYPTDFFFPPDGGWKGSTAGRPSKHPTDTYAAPRMVCGRCPVNKQCLKVALEEELGMGRGARFGMRGGLTPWQRWSVARQRRQV